MHERSFTYFFSKFYRLIEKKVFQYTALLALCKSDNSFQMQIDFSIKLPNKKCNVFPCYMLYVCLLRNIRYQNLSRLKCSNSNNTLFLNNRNLLFIEICIIFLSCLSHVLLNQTRDLKLCFLSFHPDKERMSL